ncbi:MAG: electron transfer flavoprotein subunit alpha/FixB family protein [Desulfatitalea sp.]|nr:electron transfer flavoprotein subunit alpha/FixB family protein [Desulfatitalea sp.]NNK01204.1 electron transfer flavoprotein subunit alpha/FixB family protein [Desulfatitalea sp.]
MGDTKQIWVIGGRDGYTIGDETLELMTEAHDMAKKTDCRITVVIFGEALDETIALLAGRRIADRLVTFEAAAYRHYDPAAYMAALAQLAQTQPPDIVLAPATSMGRDLAPRLAFHLGAQLISNIQQIQLTPAAKIKIVKPVYGAKANATGNVPDDAPLVVTVIHGVIGVGRTKGSKATQIDRRSPPGTASQALASGYQVLEFIAADPRTIDIVDADVVVAGGRGVGGKDAFETVKAFAFLIGGAVGCSRPIVDDGILPLDRQIGQTGKTVAPDLFVSCGVSGAMQHEMGMKDAKYIIAINTDKDAPVFRISDYKVACDVNRLLPAVIKEIHGRSIEEH